MIVLGTWLATALSAPIEVSGPLVMADGRVFVNPAPQAVQVGGPSGSLATRPTFAWNSGVTEATVEPLLRLDSNDPLRSHADLRRAEIMRRGERTWLGFGVGQFRWGVLQGFAPIDVLNQIDFVEDLDGSERLGRPYAGLGWSGRNMQFDGWFLPYHRARTFPGLAGRLRPTNGWDVAQPQYGSALGALHPGFAARATVYAGSADVSLSGYTGLSRDPRYVAQFTDERLALAYDQQHQISLDAAAVVGLFVLKGEVVTRWWGEDGIGSWAVAAGADAVWAGAFGSRSDLRGFVEYVEDVRPIGTPATTMNHDFFLGGQLALNNALSTSLTAGVIVDRVTGFTSSRLTAETRIAEHWTAEAEATVFVGRSTEAIEWWLVTEDYMQLRLAYWP